MDVTIVRILRSSHPKDLEGLRRTIDRISKQTCLFMVKEISPQGLIHIHCLVHCLDFDTAYEIIGRINKGRCKSHIDKAKMYVGDLNVFMRYMTKDIKTFEEGKDFMVRLYGKSEDILAPIISSKLIVKLSV